MDPKIEQVLQMMAQPVFLVKNGIIQWCNDAAKHLICEGRKLSSVLVDEMGAYTHWDRQGPLQMELSIYNMEFNGKVRLLEEGELFVLDRVQKNRNDSGRALAQVSSHMRRILQELISSLSTLQDKISEIQSLPSETEILNRSVYRLLRLCTQISDEENLLSPVVNSHFERTNIRSLLDAFVQEAGPLLEESGWDLEYIPCDGAMHAYLDRKLTIRALYNLVSTAIGRSPHGRPVRIEAWEEGELICFSVSTEVATEVIDSFFTEIADSKRGGFSWDGLSIDIVRLIAEFHGGSILSSASEEKKRIRMVFSIRKISYRFNLRSPRIMAREYSAFHQGLVELSEVLDRRMYHPDNV